jgi:hypothetical protein
VHPCLVTGKHTRIGSHTCEVTSVMCWVNLQMLLYLYIHKWHAICDFVNVMRYVNVHMLYHA